MLQDMSVRQTTEQFGDAVAPHKERRAALLTTSALVMVAILAIPYGERYAGEVNSLLPAIDGASFVAMLVSAAILRNQYLSSRFVPHAFLSVAFATTALLLVPYTIAFPGAFSPTGFGFGPRVAAWLWVAWHASFVLLIGAYVWSESYYKRKAISEQDAIGRVRTYVAIVALIATGIDASIFRFGHAMPVLLTPTGYSPLFHALVEELLLASCACVFITLVARTFLRGTTHLWLGVVLIALAIDMLVGGELVRAPFTLAWYLALATNLAWQFTFLIVQLRTASDRLAAYATDTRSLIEATLRDALTGLYNRRAFDARCEEALRDAGITRTPLALLALDLDWFKAYNDHYGHLRGDDALRAIASALAEVANRPGDACFRTGGEEFAILLTATDAAGAFVVAERLRLAVIRLQIAHAPSLELPILTISIGIGAVDGGRALAPKDLYERGDRALYKAKALGRNRSVAYEEPRDAGLRAV